MTSTTADPMTHEHQPTPEQVRRGRRMGLLLCAVGFGPMVIATLMFYTGWLNPAGHTNEGTLMAPPVPVASLQLETRKGIPLADRFGEARAEPNWLMLVVAGRCEQDCEQLLYLSRQVNIALGKNAPRVSRASALTSVPETLSQRWKDQYGRMERLQVKPGATPEWPSGITPESEPRLLLVDPMGNVMMHYGTEHSGKQILKDLKHLLKLSQIG